MSLRYEQYHSLKTTKVFLNNLLDPSTRPKINEMKAAALWCLRHFPFLKDDGEPMFSCDTATPPGKEHEIKQLEDEIFYHKYLYYEKAMSTELSDYEYDKLEERLRVLHPSSDVFKAAGLSCPESLWPKYERRRRSRLKIKRRKDF